MKFNKKLLAVFISFAFIFAFNLSAEAQKRRVTTKKKTAATQKRRTTTRNSTAVRNSAANSFEVKASAEKVSTQIKNVTKFLYALGGIARGIEDIDLVAKTKKISRATVDKNSKFKQDVISSLRNLRAGLAVLEVEFRAKPALKNYLIHIQGVTDLSGRAEDLAAAGNFTESGKSLLLVVERLTDTLAAMP